MIFSRTESLKQYAAWYPVTSVWIILNLVLFALMELTGSSESRETLLRFGAFYQAPGLNPEMWRYVSSIFLHIGFAHLLFNCFALYVFAPPLERMLGTWRYLFFSLMSGIAGNIASVLLHSKPFLSAGSSGAIYGIYAAYLYLVLVRRNVLDQGTRVTVLTILAVGLLYSIIVPHVNLYAHLGGLVGGFGLIALIAWNVRRRF